MFEFNRHRISYSSQSPIDSIEEVLLGYIVLWANPFAFQYPPQGFGNVEMWRIWRQIKEEKPTAFPKVAQLLYFFVPVHTGIIQNDECVPLYPKREVIKKVNNLIGVNTFSGRESFISVISVYHSEEIDSLRLLGQDIDILITKLPAIRNISFGTDMAFIGKEKIDLSSISKRSNSCNFSVLYSQSCGVGTPLGRFLIRLYLALMRIKNV